MKRISTIVKEINKHYGVELAFDRDDHVLVCDGIYSGDKDGGKPIDYYGEFRGGYAFICEWLEKYASKLGCYWEWQNAEAIVLYTI